ncbi:MAG: hypothetical protein GX337_08175 [Christensenellaceae bacterium]|nr:hypothetical protein [Christensenellaceae bacterium]
MDIRTFCLEQYKRYPLLEVQDLVKALYQAEFGCGHLITNPKEGLERLKMELETCRMPVSGDMPPLVEPLGDTFCRVHLQPFSSYGMSVSMLFSLFEKSAEQVTGSMEAFMLKLNVLEGLIVSGDIPLSVNDANTFLNEYRDAGCPALHHSEAYRSEYNPAYRVIRADLVRFLYDGVITL